MENQLLVALMDRERPEVASDPFSIRSLAKLTGATEAEVESALRALEQRQYIHAREGTQGGTLQIVAAELISVPGRNAALLHQGAVREFWESRG